MRKKLNVWTVGSSGLAKIMSVTSSDINSSFLTIILIIQVFSINSLCRKDVEFLNTLIIVSKF